MGKSFDLDAAKAKALPRLAWRDILKVNDESQMSADEIVAFDAYFSQFTLRDENLCPGCDRRLAGDELLQLMGLATFTWGLANGQGFCSECGYPARAYHRDIGGIITFLPLILAWHPDELRRKDEAEQTTETAVEV